MKSVKGFALGLALGLAVAIGTVGFAQSTKVADQTAKADSCCAMSCCSNSGSCAMHAGDKDHAKAMKHDPTQMKGQMKAHSAEGGCCCCCSGESCDLNMKQAGQTQQKQ